MNIITDLVMENCIRHDLKYIFIVIINGSAQLEDSKNYGGYFTFQFINKDANGNISLIENTIKKFFHPFIIKSVDISI